MPEVAFVKAVSAVSARSAPATPKANPASVVVIDEGLLETDLASAIRRVREDPQTSAQRILVIAREDVQLETDEAARSPLILRPAPPPRTSELARRPEGIERKAIGESLRRIGSRIQRTAESMDLFIEAGKQIVEELKTAPYEGDRLHLKKAIRRTAELMDWLEVTNRDMLYLAGKASQGMEELSTRDLLRDAARVTRLKHPGVDIAFPDRKGDTRLYADPFLAYQAFALALGLLCERIGGRGRIEVRVEKSAFHLDHYLRGVPKAGSAPPNWQPEPASTVRLRHLVIDRHAGRIFPGGDGPEGATMVIGLPLRGFEAEIREEA